VFLTSPRGATIPINAMLLCAQVMRWSTITNAMLLCAQSCQADAVIQSGFGSTAEGQLVAISDDHDHHDHAEDSPLITSAVQRHGLVLHGLGKRTISDSLKRSPTWWVPGRFGAGPLNGTLEPVKTSEPLPACWSNATRAPTKRIAVVLRGDSFRDSLAQHCETSCGCDLAKDRQLQNVDSVLSMVADMERDGYAVDIFAATYPCTNAGVDWVHSLPGRFGKYLKSFRLVENRVSYGQLSMLNLSVSLVWEKMAAEPALDYDFLVILRWDFLVVTWADGCLLDTDKPVDGTPADQVEVIPARYFSCFAEKLEQHARRGEGAVFRLLPALRWWLRALEDPRMVHSWQGLLPGTPRAALGPGWPKVIPPTGLENLFNANYLARVKGALCLQQVLVIKWTPPNHYLCDKISR
jgi:hypothetical protein